MERWAFDLEVLYLSFQNNVPVKEMAVNWHDVEGSHLDVADASLQMLRDMILIRVLYATGVWNLNDSVAVR